MTDDLGDRMKKYESACEIPLLPTLPILVRIDGKSFSRLTRNMDKPFDLKFMYIMQQVSKLLADTSNAVISYNQSDEISLLLYSPSYEKQTYFDSKRSKLISVLASQATLYFNGIYDGINGGVFDCRVWQVPNKEEAVNYFIWRQKDCIRNSIQSMSRAYFSHKECNNKTSNDLVKMLLDKDIDWNQESNQIKYGTFFKREYKQTSVTQHMLDKLPDNSLLREKYSTNNNEVKRRIYNQYHDMMTEKKWEERISFVFGENNYAN